MRMRVFALKIFLLSSFAGFSAEANVEYPYPAQAPDGLYKDRTRMRLLVGRSFRMGDGVQERKRHAEVDDFYIDKNQITIGEYRFFLDKSGYDTETQIALPEQFTPLISERELSRGNGYEHLPALVTYADAEAYAEWVGKRLPTEKEWEFAARGKEEYRFCWGNDFPTEDKRDEDILNEARQGAFWYYGLRESTGPIRGLENRASSGNPYRLMAVGSFEVNIHGLSDMTGNGDEWTSTSDGCRKDWKITKGGGGFHDQVYEQKWGKNISLMSDDEIEEYLDNTIHLGEYMCVQPRARMGFRLAMDYNAQAAPSFRRITTTIWAEEKIKR